jgi:hypothetical protein
MVPRLAAMRRARVEQLLRDRGAGQREAERTRAFEGKVEILLVQLDSKARFEISLDHPLAMHFENPR